MKSIADQYKQLQEGKLSQFNFMRNLRMTLPQYINNMTSFNDAVKILKHKSIISESKECDIDKVDAVQLAKGTDYENKTNLIKDQDKAQKTALKNLLKNPGYYAEMELTGDTKKVEPKEKKRTDLPVEVSKKNLTDKNNAAKTPKGVTKDKASANKAKKETIKPAKGVQVQTEKAKRAKGIKAVMPQSGGKTKTLKLKEALGEGPMDDQQHKDEINGFARLVKTKNIPEIIEFLENHSANTNDYLITSDEVNKIIDRYLSPEQAEQVWNSVADEASVDLYPGNMGDEMSAPTSLEEDEPKPIRTKIIKKISTNLNHGKGEDQNSLSNWPKSTGNDENNQKPFNPIKPDDLPLDKYLDSLDEDHMDTKEDKINFILQSGNYKSTPEELATKSDQEIDIIYQTVEKINQDRANSSSSSSSNLNLGSSFDKFKNKLKEIIDEVLQENENE